MDKIKQQKNVFFVVYVEKMYYLCTTLKGKTDVDYTIRLKKHI